MARPTTGVITPEVAIKPPRAMVQMFDTTIDKVIPIKTMKNKLARMAVASLPTLSLNIGLMTKARHSSAISEEEPRITSK
jgi:hypothetical protein